MKKSTGQLKILTVHPGGRIRYHSSQKKAIVTPRLKKKGMDLGEPSSFRPISNLSFMSKILEKIVVKQLMSYLMESNLLPKFQSGYRSHHSTETLLVRLLSDIHTAIDNGEVTVLALLDVSAAFDSVDHNILLQRLRTSFGFGGQCWNGWSRSFVVDLNPSILATSNPSGVSSALEYRRDPSSDHCDMYFSQQMAYKSLEELAQESNNTPTIHRHTDTARRTRQRRRFEGFRALSQKLETGCHLSFY